MFKENTRGSKVFQLAVKEGWMVSEIQPLLFFVISTKRSETDIFEDRYTMTETIGLTERIYNQLSDAGIDTIEELSKETVKSVKMKCNSMGIVLSGLLLEAFSEFDNYPVARKRFVAELMPNYNFKLPRRYEVGLMEVLFLDDDMNRTKKFISQVPYCKYAETAEECIEALGTKELWHMVFLDHDLGGEVYVDSKNKNTGSEVVRWIVDNKPKIDEIVVHSLNYPAGKAMEASLRECGYKATYCPWTSIYKDIVEVFPILENKEEEE